jgi:hypothetical protein
MYLQKVISRKNCVKNLFFAGILKVNEENSRTRIQDPDPDPLVRSMDSRIRIHLKMSWIQNTNCNHRNCCLGWRDAGVEVLQPARAVREGGVLGRFLPPQQAGPRHTQPAKISLAGPEGKRN